MMGRAPSGKQKRCRKLEYEMADDADAGDDFGIAVIILICCYFSSVLTLKEAISTEHFTQS